MNSGNTRLPVGRPPGARGAQDVGDELMTVEERQNVKKKKLFEDEVKSYVNRMESIDSNRDREFAKGLESLAELVENKDDFDVLFRDTKYMERTYSTAVETLASIALAAMRAHPEYSEITGMQAQFIAWKLMKHLGLCTSTVGHKLIDVADYLDVDNNINVISKDTHSELKALAAERLRDVDTDCVSKELRHHWYRISQGECVGFRLEEDE